MAKENKMAHLIPFPDPINITSGDIIENIELFTECFNTYEIATGLDEEDSKVRVATLLSAIGLECFKAYKNLPLTVDEKKTTQGILDGLKKHLAPKLNVIYERYVFNTSRQEEEESVDQFIMRLRRLVENCQYSTLKDELLRDRIVVGVRNVSAQKKMLTQDKLTLLEAISIGRAMESTETHLRSMNPSKLEDVNKIVTKSVKRNTSRSCHFCGGNHEFKKDLCPAFGKKCNQCGGKDHFARVCRNSKAKSDKEAKKIKEIVSDDCVEQVDSNVVDEDFIYEIKPNGERMIVALDMKISGMNKYVSNKCQLDSAATATVAGYKNLCEIFGRDIKACITSSNRKLKAFGGQYVKQMGQIVVECLHAGEIYKLVFQVMPFDHIPLLSCTACLRLKLLQPGPNVKIVNKIQSSIQESTITKSSQSLIEEAEFLLKKYGTVFENTLGKLENEVSLEIDPNVKPSIQNPRRVPIKMRDTFKQRIDELVEWNVIAKVDKHTPWVSNLVFAVRNDKMRICLDPIPLNKALKRPNFQMPTIDEILPELSKAKVFTKLDASKGFWQLQLDEGSSYLTTFWTPWGRYRWLRCPFGVKSAPELFQMALYEIIHDLEGVKGIADDILVYGCGNNYEEALNDHNLKLEKLLQRLKQANLKMNKDKIRLCKREILFYGHLLTDTGLKPDPMKTSAITNIPAPQNKQDLRRFLGMTTYLGKYLKNLSSETVNLRHLLEDNTEWSWDKQQEIDFNKIKGMICSAPTLQYFDVRKPVVIECDASGYGLGAVLLQENEPVAFASKTLTSAERNYVQMEREALAILFSCRRFDQYIVGKGDVTVQTDHLPLLTIFNKPLITAPKRLQRIMLGLQRYTLNLVYKKGTEMHVADALSRAPEKREEEMKFKEIYHLYEDDSIFCEIESINALEDLRVSDERLQEIKRETLLDSDMQSLYNLIVQGWPEDIKSVPECLRLYWNYKEELNAQQGLIFKRDRVVIPRNLRSDMLKRLHLSHSGIEGCLKLAKDTIFWPSITVNIKEAVQNCEECLAYSASQPKEPMQSHEIPKYPFQRVGLDPFEVHGKEFLVTVDYYSDYFELDEISSPSAKNIIEASKQNFARHGVPEMVVSDGAKGFTSSEFEQFSKEWEFQHSTSSPHHQQGNGKSESAVKIAKAILLKTKATAARIKRSMATDNGIWKAILLWRNTPNKMNSSPVQRIFSRRTRCSIPVPSSKLKPEVIPNVSEDIAYNRQQAKKYYDRRIKVLPDLEIGQPVYVRTKPQLQKSVWESGVVNEKLNSRSYMVDVADAQLRRNREHIKSTPNKLADNRSGKRRSIMVQDSGQLFDDASIQLGAEPILLENPSGLAETVSLEQPSAESSVSSRPKRTIRLPVRYSD